MFGGGKPSGVGLVGLRELSCFDSRLAHKCAHTQPLTHVHTTHTHVYPHFKFKGAQPLALMFCFPTSLDPLQNIRSSRALQEPALQVGGMALIESEAQPRDGGMKVGVRDKLWEKRPLQGQEGSAGPSVRQLPAGYLWACRCAHLL
jgi:hypothetical protein